MDSSTNLYTYQNAPYCKKTASKKEMQFFSYLLQFSFDAGQLEPQEQPLQPPCPLFLFFIFLYIIMPIKTNITEITIKSPIILPF